MESLLALYDNLTVTQVVLIGFVVLLVWFLPAMLAAVFNPCHAKIIFVACIPAGFSFIAWSALMVWAFTGKVWEKYADKVEKKASEVDKPVS